MAQLDLVVVGGGITGLGVARLAARNGLSVALLERGDLAAGASSASSHMLHGGLRYLEHFRFGLVREALRERAAVSRMAPTLVTPRRFLVPLYRGGRVPPWKLSAGLRLYDWLAGGAALAPHSFARPREAARLEPALSTGGLRAVGLYSDVVVDDAGLAIAVARDAVAHGLQLHTYHEATGARPGPDGAVEVLARDAIAGVERRFAARQVVNATGAWSDLTRRRFSSSLHPGGPEPAPWLRPSRGIHLVYPPLTEGHALLLIAGSDGRPFFVVPFAGHTLVGTTEVEVPSPFPAEAARATVDEVRYLRSELARALPGHAGIPPLAVIAGVRPLLASADPVDAAPREHRVLDEGPVLSIAGGKYTTFRVMARDVLQVVWNRLHRAGRPLADPLDPLPRRAEGLTLPEEAGYAIEHEFARRLEDVLRRRTHLWLEPDRGRVAAPAVAAEMARRLGWSAERTDQELRSYEAALWDEEELLRHAREDA